MYLKFKPENRYVFQHNNLLPFHNKDGRLVILLKVIVCRERFKGCREGVRAFQKHSELLEVRGIKTVEKGMVEIRT